MPENSLFPHDEIDALSLLYIQHQDLAGLAPEEIYNKYKDCHQRMTNQKNRKPEDEESSYISY